MKKFSNDYDTGTDRANTVSLRFFFIVVLLGALAIAALINFCPAGDFDSSAGQDQIQDVK